MELSRTRKAVFSLLGLGLTLAILELGAFLVLSAGEGRWMIWSEVRALRQVQIATESDPTVPGDDDQINVNVANSVIHPFLGFVRDPATVALGRFNAQAHDFGFIQNRHTLFQQPSSNRVVIGVLGGSVARNLATLGQILEGALEASPRFSGRDVVVLSLATGGFKQPQQLNTLNFFLALGAHFDLVINLDGFNEVVLTPAQNIPSEVFPFYPNLWRLRVGTLNLEERRRIGKLVFLREQRRDLARGFSKSPWHYSSTAALLWKGLDNRAQSRISEAEQSLERTDRIETGDDYQGRGPRWPYDDDEQMYQDLATLWRRSSHQIHLLARGLGIEYHHLLQPNQYIPDTKPLSEEEKVKFWLPKHSFRPHVLAGYPELIEAGEELRRQGVAFHDLTRIFEDHPETLYRDSCCHLNRRGNELLAEAVARALEGAS